MHVRGNRRLVPLLRYTLMKTNKENFQKNDHLNKTEDTLYIISGICVFLIQNICCNYVSLFYLTKKQVLVRGRHMTLQTLLITPKWFITGDKICISW